MMTYYAKGLKELIKTTELNIEFFESLNEFQLNFLEMCFKKNHDEQIGMMSDIESKNYELFTSFRVKKFEKDYGLDEEIWKKAS